MSRLTTFLLTTLVWLLGATLARGAEPPKPDPMAGQGGVSSVDQANGDYSYSIALALPFFHGLEPQPTLAYSSAGANGYVGVGWSLSGFGQIVRGAPTRWGSPSFSEHDTFSLDGNLLLACASLGTPATVPSCAADLADDDANHVYYATQIESYAILYLDRGPGVNGGWGQWVRIDTRGIRKVYGAGYVVAQPASPDNVFKWLETTTNDPHGNTVELTWDFNLLGDCCAEYPTGVIYHYPSGPKKVAEFFWERREDVESIALPNNARQAFARLAAVDLASPEGLPLRAYDLDYGTSAGTRRSLLTSIDVYAHDRVRLAATATSTGGVGPGPAGALIPTRKTYVFSYIADALQSSFTGEPGSGKAHYEGHAPFCTNADEQLLTGDFDGDGRTDLGCFRPNRNDASRLMIARSDGTRWTDANWGAEVLDFCVDGNARLSINDLDGDGKDDLICAIHSVSTVMSTGSKFVAGPGSGQACPMTGEPKWQNYLTLADFNGDGWTDLGCHFQDELYVQRGWDHDADGRFDGFEPTSAPIGWGQVGCSDTGFFGLGDFNGDGASDLYCMRVLGDPKAALIRVFLSNNATRFVDMGDWNTAAPGSEGGGFCTSKHEWNIQPKSLLLGDFNADGKTDMLCVEQDPNRPGYAQLQVSLSQGNSPGPARDWGHYPECGTRSIQAVGDVDGDGKTDLACTHVDVDQGFDHTYVRPSTGRSFAAAVDWKPKWCMGGRERYFDVDGDSRVDLTCTHYRTSRDGPDLGYVFALAGGRHGLTQTRGPIDLLETITTPAGGTLAVGYLPASSFSNAFGPPPTGPVVTQVAALDNQQYTTIASAPTIRYSYVGSRHDQVERRSLGYFETTQQLPWVAGDAHPSQGPIVVTQYLQDYGSLAKPLSIRKFDAPAGNVLSIDTFTYWVNGAAPYRSHVADEWHTSCGPGQASNCATRKQRHLSYCAAYSGQSCTLTYHDDHGNRSASIDYGIEGSNPPPAVTTMTRFAKPQARASNLVEQPADIALYQGVGNGGPLLSRKRFQYDGLDWGTIGALGEQTKVEGFLASGTLTLATTRYDVYGRITRESDALGNPTTYEYDAYHRLVRSINPKGQDVGVAAFHPNCNTPTQFSNLADQISTATYDAFCRITSTTDPLGPTLNYTYHDVGVQKTNTHQTMRFKAAHASPGGVQDHAVVTYVDGLGRSYQTKVVAARPAAANDYLTRSVLSRNGYDARGNVASQTVPFVYGDANVPATRTTYDALGRVVESIMPGGGATTRYQYDLAEAGVWGTGVETVKQIDPLGTPSLSAPGMTSTGAFEKTCEYVAPSSGASNGSWHCRKANKDLLGRIVQVYEPDAKGSPTLLVSSAEYDMLDRVVHVWDAARGHVYSRYDAIGNPIRVLDARGTLTCFEYDSLGRVTREQTMLASAVTPAQLSETTPCTNPSESVETFYDSYPASPPSNLSGSYFNASKPTMVLTRDARGQVTSKRSYGHDAAGRLIASVLEIDGLLFRRSMTYDAAGRLASTTYPDGDVITHAYDNQGNMIGLSASGSPIAKPSDLAARGDWQYDAAAHLQYLELGNGTIRRTSYEPARGWLTRIRVDKGSTNLLDHGYQDRDAIGLLRSITSTNAAQSATGTWHTDHTAGITYDSQYRMLTATGDANSIASLAANPASSRGKWTVTMRYSPTGEILSRNAQLLESSRTPIGLQGDYCYSSTNRHAVRNVVDPGRGCDPTAWPQSYAPPSFTYDAGGNMLTHRSPSSTITWNGDGRPTQMAVGGATQAFVYEGQGQRIKAISGSVSSYYDGDFEWSGTGTTKLLRVAGQVIARRVSSKWTPPSVGGSSSNPTWTTQYVHQNHLGSFVLITDEQGNPVARTIYSPWGERIAGSKTGSHGFSGEREDDTGLIYLNARYYDPTLSRFVSADPMTPGKSLGSLDRYAYALDNPLRWVDPTGHRAEVDPIESKRKAGAKASASLGSKSKVTPLPGSPPPSSTPAPPGGTATPTPTPHPVAPGTPSPPAAPAGPSVVTQVAVAIYEPVTSYMMASYTSSTPTYGSQTWTAQPGNGWGVYWIDQNGTEHQVDFADAVKYAGIDPPDKRDPNMWFADKAFEYIGERSYGQGQVFWDAMEGGLGTDVLAAVCQIHDVQFEYGWAQADGNVDAQHAAGGMSLNAMLPDLLLIQMLKEADSKIIVDGSVFEQKMIWAHELETMNTRELSR